MELAPKCSSCRGGSDTDGSRASQVFAYFLLVQLKKRLGAVALRAPRPTFLWSGSHLKSLVKVTTSFGAQALPAHSREQVIVHDPLPGIRALHHKLLTVLLALGVGKAHRKSVPEALQHRYMVQVRLAL